MLSSLSLWTALTVILMAICAGFFYTFGEHERRAGWLWCALSAAVSVAIWIFGSPSLLWLLLGQFALFVVATVVNMTRGRKARVIK